MIKVQVFTNESNDVCDIIENRITSGMEIEDWIIKNINGISFECMDFPCDMEFCYECYFQSNMDKLKAQEIFNLLKLSFLSILDINFYVYITDDNLNEMYKII